MREINSIVIRCSASKNGDGSVTLETVDGWHKAKGWRKVGYHYIIQVDGVVRVGRLLEEIGAHVQGNNAKSIGICMIGTDRFSPEQWDALRGLVQDLAGQFPAATIVGHRDYSPDLDGDGLIEAWEWFKLCPGFEVSAWRLSGMDPLWDPKHLFVKGAAGEPVV